MINNEGWYMRKGSLCDVDWPRQQSERTPFFLFRGCQAVSGTGSHACGGKARMTVLVRMDVCTSWSTRFFRFSGHCLFASQANGCIQTCPSCSLTSGSTKNTSPGQLAVPYRSFRYLQPQASLGSYRHAKVCLVATLGTSSVLPAGWRGWFS